MCPSVPVRSLASADFVPPMCPPLPRAAVDADISRWSLPRQLTDAFLRSVKPPASGRREIRDVACGGLIFRITAAGIRSWSFRFRDAAGQQPRATIGEYPAIGLRAARAAADAMRARVAAGGNPVEERREARRGAGAKTFGGLAARYVAEH